MNRLIIAAHADDAEIMAFDAVLKAYLNSDDNVSVVIVTDGAGPVRTGKYADFSNEQMVAVRIKEQKKAAKIGKYGKLFMLGHSSSAVKNEEDSAVTDDLVRIIQEIKPDIIYTHNPFDKHLTHVKVCMKAVGAIKESGKSIQKLYGCEVWRSLDFIADSDKCAFDVSAGEKLAKKLLACFESQIAGGKRYDEGTIGRWKANAVFYKGREADSAKLLSFGIDMTDLITTDMTLENFVTLHIDRLKEDILGKINSK